MLSSKHLKYHINASTNSYHLETRVEAYYQTNPISNDAIRSMSKSNRNLRHLETDSLHSFSCRPLLLQRLPLQ